LVLNYLTDQPWGHVDWSLGATWNETTITHIIASPPELGGQPLFNSTALSDLTTASPKLILNAGMAWTMSIWSVTVREILYGPSSEWDNDGGYNPANFTAPGAMCSGGECYFNERVGTIPITNLELGMEPMKHFKFAIGATNLFNRYPEQINPNLTKAYDIGVSNAGVTKYANFSPFGFDGGFYYARASYRF
jgi:iron complex outermembrane recepter protein